MGAPTTLKHSNGTAVTAQEAEDAFMNTRDLSGTRDGIRYEAISMDWYDNNSAHADPANVGCVKLYYMYNNSGTAIIKHADAGDSSLVPTQQG